MPTSGFSPSGRLRQQVDRAQALEFWRLEYTRRKIRKDMLDGVVDGKLLTEAAKELLQATQKFLPTLETLIQLSPTCNYLKGKRSRDKTLEIVGFVGMGDY